MNRKKTFTTVDISKICDVYPTTVANWIDSGKLKAFVTPGGHRRVKTDDLVKFLKKHKMPLPGEVKTVRKKILIVDDEKSIRDSLSKLLKKYEVFTAEDGFQAGHITGAVKPDLLILDIRLPGIDGFEVIRRIRQYDKKVKILAISGWADLQTEERILKAGADGFLEKPWEISVLKKKIETLLDSRTVKRQQALNDRRRKR